jgi:hypothetical protein
VLAINIVGDVRVLADHDGRIRCHSPLHLQAEPVVDTLANKAREAVTKFRVGDRVHRVPEQSAWQKDARAYARIRAGVGTVTSVDAYGDPVIEWDTKPGKPKLYRAHHVMHKSAVDRLASLLDDDG